MERNFQRALDHVLKHEGGWADHPRDPGGATMKGVTLATFRRYRPGASKNDLRNISDADLRRIYRDGYWDVVKGDSLPSGVDFAVFDFAVNSGPSRAAKYLQSVVKVKADGVVGPVTLAAVNKKDPSLIIRMLCDRRMSFLMGLSTFDTFGRGWTRRVNEVQATAESWVDNEVVDPPEPAAPTPPYQPEPGKPKGKPVAAGLFGIFLIAAYFIARALGVDLPWPG